MLFDVRKNYAKEISMDFGIDYSKILTMTLAEIEEISREKFKKKLEYRKSGNGIKKFKLLMKDYDYYYKKLGEYLIEAFYYGSEDSYFEWSDKGDPWVDYESDEAKGLITNNETGWYSRNKLKIKRFSAISVVFENAITLKFPELIKYSPQIHGYSGEWLDAELSFIIATEINDEGDKKNIHFNCTLGSFLELDKESMIEDHLDSIGFCGCENKEEPQYIKTNELLSSHMVKEFFDVIENLTI